VRTACLRPSYEATQPAGMPQEAIRLGPLRDADIRRRAATFAASR
jgi:hypothetical protein